MELAVLFFLGWVMSHAFSEKRDEYSASQEAHREQYLAKLDKHHPSWGRARREQYLRNAARRNSLGHFAYLLRHGWSSTFNDFAHGWENAKTAHEEWKSERPEGEKKPSAWETFKAGWKSQVVQRPQPERPEPAPVTPPVPMPGPETGQTWREKHDLENRYQRFAELRRRSGSPLTAAQLVNEVEVDSDGAAELSEQWNDRFERENPSESTAKVFPISGKTTRTPGNTAGSTNRSTTVEFNYDRTRTVMAGIDEFAARTLSVVEQIIADAIAGQMNADTETMTHLTSLQEALSNTRAHATAVASSMAKHASGQEYANTGHAASTDYLKSN